MSSCAATEARAPRKRKAPASAVAAERLPMRMEMALRQLRHAAAVQLAQEVDSRHLLGMPCKPRTVVAQAAEFKRERPEAVVLLRVGEMYEAYGVDAVLVKEHDDACKVCAGLRAVLHHGRVQHVCTALVGGGGWTVAVYEESSVIGITPRHRYLAQIVSRANPVYCHAADHDAADGGAVDAQPVVGVVASADGGAFDVVRVDLVPRTYRVLAQVDRTVAEALASQAAPPLLCLRRPPAFAVSAGMEHRVLCGDAHASLEARVLEEVRATHAVEGLRRVAAVDDGGCAPLTRFTLHHLGIGDEYDRTPSLAAACTTKRATAPLRGQMEAWLRQPPPYAGTLAALVAALRRRGLCATLAPLAPARWRAAAVPHVLALGRNLRAMQALCRRVADDDDDARAAGGGEDDDAVAEACLALRDALARAHGLVASALRFDALEGTLLAYLRADGLDALDDRQTAASAEALAAATAARDAYLATLPADTYTLQQDKIALFGAPQASLPERLPFFDRNGRIVAGRHSTAASMHYDGAVAEAAARAAEHHEQLVRDLLAHVATHEAEALVVHAFALAVATVHDHVRAVGKTWTVHATAYEEEEGDGGLAIQGLWPYWMTTAVRNDVRLDPGQPLVLTGPNGGGKSTMLRAIASVVLLAHCGLLAPCTSARVPRVTHLFLRTGASDCAAERKSAFVAEMCDLATMMRAPGRTLLLVDEPCRGTATGDGVALLRACLTTVAATARLSAWSTHFHELDLPATCTWMQLSARVDPVTADTTPEFVLRPGRCDRSLALHCALAAGVPVEVVRAACAPRDEETEVLAALYAVGLGRFARLRVGELPPAQLASVVYVLLTADGVYVGESDEMCERVVAHQRSKAAFGTVLYAEVADKTAALSYEARMIQELQYRNVRLVSARDGQHVIRRA